MDCHSQLQVLFLLTVQSFSWRRKRQPNHHHHSHPCPQYSCLEVRWTEDTCELQSMGWQSRTGLSSEDHRRVSVFSYKAYIRHIND